VLLIERKFAPGKGLYALPGGFVDGSETIFDSCIRELREETKLKVPEKVLRGSNTYSKVFDAPDRSQRGRTITHAFLFELNDSEPLPRVRGSDDAASASWVSFAEIDRMPECFFEDHYHIIQHMIARSK
jgi:bifunctional NMN adenylyltransferase/nudix hydrolase